MEEKKIDKIELLLNKAIKYGVIVAISILVLVTFLFFYGETFNQNKINDSKFSSYGTFVGALISIVLNAVTIYILYYTFRTQREDLKETKKELALTRKINQEQSDTISLQQFENTFFKLLDNHVKLIGSYDGNISGYDSLQIDFQSLTQRINQRCVSSINRAFTTIECAEYSDLEEPLFKNEFIGSIIEDILTIIEFIEGRNKKPQTFYHNIFFNTLRESERYFIALYLHVFHSGVLEKYESIYFGQYLKTLLKYSPNYLEYRKLFLPRISFSLYLVSHSTNLSLKLRNFNLEKGYFTIINRESVFNIDVISTTLNFNEYTSNEIPQNKEFANQSVIPFELNIAIDKLLFDGKLIPLLNSDVQDKSTALRIFFEKGNVRQFFIYVQLRYRGEHFEYTFPIHFSLTPDITSSITLLL